MGAKTALGEPAAKNTLESREFPMEFRKDLPVGDTLSGTPTFASVPPTGITLTVPTTTGSRATVNIASGTIGQLYLITCVVLTSASETLYGEGYLQVD